VEEISEERKGDTSLAYSGRIALRWEQCGVFAPCKNCNCKDKIDEFAMNTRNKNIRDLYRGETLRWVINLEVI
jgi:hypothetical protein